MTPKQILAEGRYCILQVHSSHGGWVDFYTIKGLTDLANAERACRIGVIGGDKHIGPHDFRIVTEGHLQVLVQGGEA